MTVQMPNLTLNETKRITVYLVGTETASSNFQLQEKHVRFYFIYKGKQTMNKITKEQKKDSKDSDSFYLSLVSY
jgi:hypothetical protein